MKAYQIQIDAWDGSTASPIRLASHNDDRLCHLDGKTWWPAIAALPTLRYDFFDGAFDAASIASPSGDMSVAFSAIPNLPALSLHDTRIRIWRGELGDAWGAFTPLFDGRVREQPATEDGIATVSFGVDDSWLDQPLLAPYGGTGGADGPPEAEGEAKSLALGAPRFVPATLVDAVDNIYQISGYGAINGVEVAFDRLSRFGASYGNAASFAALKAADIPAGQWRTSLAGGYVRFGAPPAGLVSFHVQGDAVGGWTRLPGDLIARIATLAGGAGRFSTSDMATLNIARPWNLSIMVTAQTTARDLIQRIATSVNAVAYVDWLGVLRVVPLGIGAPTMNMAADGSALPPVASVEQIAIAAPYWKIAQGAAVTWQVHGLNDIAFNAPLNPRGPYDPAETYREGDMVTLPNGSQWLFVGTTPATGSAPSDANANWYRLADNITAGNITYEDGTPVEDLKPAEPGATDGASPEQVDQLNQLAIDTAQAQIDIAAAQTSITNVQTEVTDLGTQILAAEGEIDTLQTEQVTQGAAITTLQTTASTQAGQLASISTSLTTANANIAINASAISGLTSSVSTLSSTVSTMGASVSANATAITTLQGNVATLTTRVNAGSQNIFPFGQFSNGWDGWLGHVGFNVIDNGLRGPAAYVNASSGTAYTADSVLRTAAAGFSYTISADIERTGTSGSVAARIIWSNGAGSNVIGPAATKASGSFQNTFSGRVFATGTCPAGMNSYWVQLVVEGGASGTQGFRQIKVELGTTPSPWSDEATVTQSFSALSTLTTQYASLSTTVSTQGVTISTQQTAITTINGNVTTLFGQYVLDVEVGGLVAGMKLANNGSATSLRFRSDLVTFESSSGSGQRTEYSGGNWRIYDSSGTLRVRMGVW